MKMAVTMFAACALNPPMLPAAIEPTKFLLILRSTSVAAVVLRRLIIVSRGTIASATTDFPRPSILHKQYVGTMGQPSILHKQYVGTVGQLLMVPPRSLHVDTQRRVAVTKILVSISNALVEFEIEKICHTI